jgi:hypothetical protein
MVLAERIMVPDESFQTLRRLLGPGGVQLGM